MALYEHVFLARQDLSQAQVDALAATATEIVEKGEGKVTKTETWGLKSLAYKIVRVEEHEGGPSVMMRKNERDRKRRSDREERD